MISSRNKALLSCIKGCNSCVIRLCCLLLSVTITANSGLKQRGVYSVLYTHGLLFRKQAAVWKRLYPARLAEQSPKYQIKPEKQEKQLGQEETYKAAQEDIRQCMRECIRQPVRQCMCQCLRQLSLIHI